MNAVTVKIIRAAIFFLVTTFVVLLVMTVIPTPAIAGASRLKLGARMLVGVPAALLVAWFMLRYGWFANGKGTLWTRTLPASAPGPDRTSRIAETVILAVAGLVILTLTATNSSTHGLLLMLDQIRPEMARIQIVVLGCVLAGVALALLVTWFCRAALGIVLMAAILCSYGWILNGPGELIDQLTPDPATQPIRQLIIRVGNDLVGADVWINGVHLGKSPITTTVDEFLAKVPYWSEPPEGFRDKSNELHLPDGSMSAYSMMSTYFTKYSWIKFTMSDYSFRHNRPGRPNQSDSRDYYAQVKLGEEQGFGDFGRFGGNRGGPYWQVYEFDIPAIFPERRERLERLLDKARLANYIVDHEWYQAMESYGSDGWDTLRKAAQSEPDLEKIMDACAVQRYELHQVTDADSAWTVFQQICDQADTNWEYSTTSAAGKAVELLVPNLDPERLINHAKRLIRQRKPYGYETQIEYGQFAFSYGRNARFYGEKYYPPSAYVVAHAIWKLHQWLDEKNHGQPNLVEVGIVPDLICWYGESPNSPALQISTAFGGPVIDNFLLRHNWRLNGSTLPWSERWREHGNEVNGWLYLLAYLQDEAGKTFRKENMQRMTLLADELLSRPWMPGSDLPAFLFDDLKSGNASLAVQYWPRYQSICHIQEYDSLRAQWKYLVKMDTLSTVQMYLDAWRNYTYDFSWKTQALKELDPLPSPKRQAVIDALLQELREHPTPANNWSGSVNGWHDYLMARLEDHASDDYITNKIIGQLQHDSSAQYLKMISPWLEHTTRPDHPLIPMLAKADNPMLRLAVMGALKFHPTPENRLILDRLRQDPDALVRTAAEKVWMELKTLRESSSMSFASREGNTYTRGSN